MMMFRVHRCGGIIVITACPDCGGSGGVHVEYVGEVECEGCAGTGEHVSGDVTWMVMLAENLAIGAALCHSHALGRLDRHFEIHGIGPRWFPGCGRSAP